MEVSDLETDQWPLNEGYTAVSADSVSKISEAMQSPIKKEISRSKCYPEDRLSAMASLVFELRPNAPPQLGYHSRRL